MDLVDIDQVLDNLELCEAADEHQKLVIQTHSATVSTASTSNGLADSNSYVPHATRSHNANSNHSSSNSTSSSHNSHKAFVGVSQVFNSLDDYCKNVESLESAAPQQYDEECRRPITAAGAGTSATEKLQPTEPLDGIKKHSSSADTLQTAKETITTTNAITVESTREVVSNAPRYRGAIAESEDEEQASNDIHKFREQVGLHTLNGQDDNEELTTASTSDSLTTSSSSTFSSGPSPGVVSTTDEHSSPLSPAEDDEERKVLLATQTGPAFEECHAEEEEEQSLNYSREEQEEERQYKKSSDLPPEMQLIDESQNKANAEGVMAEPVAVLDDLAVGLSSISITTENSQSILPCDPGTTTVSSVLQNVLEDLSETTSSELLSQLREEAHRKEQLADQSRSFVTATPSDEEEKDLRGAGMESYPAQNKNHVSFEKEPKMQPDQIYPTDYNADNIQAQEEVLQQQSQPPLQQRPITFGSTMDEISDTELDSMLQEMDIDDVAETQQDIKVSVQTQLESDTLPHDPKQQTEMGVATACSDIANELVKDGVEASTGGADCCNADNFSQASTVEFSEIKAAPLHSPTVEEGAEIGVGEPEGDAEVESELRPVSPSSVGSSYSSTESSLDESDIIADANEANAAGSNAEGDGDQAALARPQRPTTLDLPTVRTSLLAHAGQTPPGGNADVVGAAANLTTEQPQQQLQGEGAQEDMSAHAGQSTQDIAEASGSSDPHVNLGKVPPIWVPDNMATACMQCSSKFTMIKRRHHCRACGKVLCSVCCSQKFKLEFLNHPESRVCVQCYLILSQRQLAECGTLMDGALADGAVGADPDQEVAASALPTSQNNRSPNPNNPMEYCSTIPPHRQVSAAGNQPPPSVIVPVGVLKKENSQSNSNSSNSSGKKARKRKSVMFSDGIAPGSELASTMETRWGDAKYARRIHQQGVDRGARGASSNKPPTPAKSEPSSSGSIINATPMELLASLFANKSSDAAAASQGSAASAKSTDAAVQRSKRPLPPSGCDERGCFIPQNNDSLPPIYVSKDENSCDYEYKEVANNFDLVATLQKETLKFALTKNFYVYVKIVHLKCCMNRTVINFTTSGMHHVGNDEIVILLEYQPPASRELMTEPPLPKDIFMHLHEIYCDADQGNPIAELSYTSPRHTDFLGSRDYGGFIYIRATFQCLQDVIVPEHLFLIGILIHRYEVPWAKVFPLRLMLRLGAQYRYYPCPHISMRNRESVYAEIAQTIINFLADFRNYSYTLPCIRGMYIHMEDRQTTVLIPRNRQEDVIKAINNASDHILAFGGNFSKTADGHLVCMQNVNDERNEMYAYSTQAINIQGQPRKVTGASFFVLNEALKSTSGLSGKCSIVEDGLMVQIMPAKMEEVRNALRNQKDINIVCGPIDAEEQQTEVVSIKWVENDRDFNIGVKSPIDDKSMEGVSTMRVHASFNYSNANYSIRLTDIYIIKYDNWYNISLSRNSADITRIAEQIARSASLALVPFLDLLAASGSVKIGLRATLHQDNVCYEAGARGAKLPPLYMNALDNHLIPTLHGESSGIEDAIILELIFYILVV